MGCSGSCSYSVECKGGVAGGERAVERQLNQHQEDGGRCGAGLGFLSVGRELIAICEDCDYFSAVTEI